MNNKRITKFLAISSLIGIVYCMAVFIYTNSLLKPEIYVPANKITMVGYFILPTYFILGLYHVSLLADALKVLANKEKNTFIHSLYIILIILSGITLLSDISILSDIGNEYMFYNVKDQWLMLYGFTIFHLIMVICGIQSSRKNKDTKIYLLEGIRNDAMFISIYQITFICGLLGIGGIILSMSGLISSIITERYKIVYMLLFSGLSLFPLLSFLVYWIVKNKTKPFSAWFDEMQIFNTAIGALVSIIITLPLIIIFTLVSIHIISLQGSFWLLLIFFIFLVTFSGTVMLKNRISN